MASSFLAPTSRCQIAKIVRNKIVFCALHESAERLLAKCDHLGKFLRTLKAADQKDENMIREVILPYVDR
jgi:hypothetical protein